MQEEQQAKNELMESQAQNAEDERQEAEKRRLNCFKIRHDLEKQQIEAQMQLVNTLFNAGICFQKLIADITFINLFV